MKPSKPHKPAPLKTPLLLAALSLSLLGCASPPPLVPVTPALPTVPALSTPLPQQPYSTSVQQLLSNWVKLLTATSVTSKPSPEAGPRGTSSPAK